MTGRRLLFAVALICSAVGQAVAGVTVLQNGISPTPEYEGCVDTWISDENWERGRDYGGGPTMSIGGKRHILIRFDLEPIPRDHVVHHAVLRLARVGYPRKRDGQWPSTIAAYALTRAFSPDANWREHTRTDYENADAGDWKTPGGEYDARNEFGDTPPVDTGPGGIATDVLVDGPWGHMHEMDVTAVVQRWHAGKMSNHGLLLKSEYRAEMASSDWYVPEFRPQLLVAHGPRRSDPQRVAPLRPAPEEIELSPITATDDRGSAKGDYAILRVGRNAQCPLRGQSTDGYIKDATERFPGTWGWMNMCRVGGRAGDFSRALLYFDLEEIPKTTSVQKAVLRLSLTPHTNREVSSYRYGAFLLQLPESPGWDAQTVTSELRRQGTRWPKGGVLTASNSQPLAVGTVVMKQVDRNGHKANVPAAVEFDLTGAVRAWIQGKVPNCGIVLDNRIEGGAYDFYSSRCFKPELRPYLEITCSPAVRGTLKPIPVKEVPVKPGLPQGDYWIQPMRTVHQRFRGTPGTLTQYGDSITVTMAYLAMHAWGDTIDVKNCSADVRKELDVVQDYSNRQLWREWKGGQWGNTGMMMSDWLLQNVDPWQKKMNPEAAVILFGTNDLGRIMPPEYTENMAASLRRMMADGTVPILTTVPPKSGRDEMVRDYWLAGLSIAHGLEVPVIDYHAEIMRRRPSDWDGRLEKFSDYQGYDVPTLISRDGTHPSNPKKHVNDFSEEALNSSGYVLRNYMTLRMYSQVISKILQPRD